MAKTSQSCANFLRTTKGFPKTAAGTPYSYFGNPVISYDDTIYSHGFRKNVGTLPKSVRLFYPIVRAAEMLKGSNIAHTVLAPDYQMVSKSATWKDASGKTVKGKEYLAELLYSDGSGFIVHKKGDEIRTSSMEPDGTNNPIGEFKTLPEVELALLWLTCLPEILAADQKEASGKLTSKMVDFETFIPQFSTWADDADVPELVKECAFYIGDVCNAYADDHANWSFAKDATTADAEQVPDTIASGKFKGSVVVTSNPNVAFKYAISNGNADKGTTGYMTIGELKAELADFSSHRKWSKAEQMMIPYFADNTPVMEETIRIARRIVGTRNAVNPVVNVMWRGVTSYGKSTGVRQLACCLNIPLMVMTCHPGMDITELKSNLVPATEGEGLEVDATAITFKKDADTEMSAELKMAIDHLSTKTSEERKDFLTGISFFKEAVMDPEGAAYTLFGKDVEMEAEELCKVYSDMVCYFQTKPLQVKIEQLQTAKPEEAPKQENTHRFIHVLSAYMKALINGYLCEIQEPSRIRDSGVLVGINEYDRAGAVIHLMSGAMAKRHKDALVIMTDNVGYASCRLIDPSVLRRFGMIIDSNELPEQLVRERARRNTGCTDSKLQDRCYEVWSKVKEYCDTNSITDGSVSPTEYECMLQAMMLDGDDAFETNLKDCIISKATCDPENQQAILSAISLT